MSMAVHSILIVSQLYRFSMVGGDNYLQVALHLMGGGLELVNHVMEEINRNHSFDKMNVMSLSRAHSQLLPA